jgi:hypothetical protein
MNLLLYLSIKEVMELTVVIIEGYHCSKFNPYADVIIRIISVNFDVIDQLLIRYPVIVRY